MICSNIGRKADRIVRKKELLLRKWLFGRFRARIVWPGSKKKDKCHSLRRHGPQFDIHAQYDRLLGRSDLRMDQQKYVSRFYSHDAMWEAREAFLVANEAAMKLRAQAIESEGCKNQSFRGSITLTNPIGEGLVGPPFELPQEKKRQATLADGVKHFSNLHTVNFVFEYSNGCWYEITAHPDVKSAARAIFGSGETIRL